MSSLVPPSKQRAVTPDAETRHSGWYVDAMRHFVDVVQHLSHARTLAEVTSIVRLAARELTGADGATFILRDGDLCYYADENAVAPLWKGHRFPMTSCISGWVMTHGESVFIEDIYQDDRIPHGAYSPTFVKSLVMVPIRRDSPMGAIGNYWAKNRIPAPEEIEILESLANVTAVAMENIDLYARLQKKIRALETSNEELNRFAWIASHDLKSPLRAIDHLAAWIDEDAGVQLNPDTRQHIITLRQRVRRMDDLLDDILTYAQLDRKRDHARAERASGRELVESAAGLLDIPRGFSLHVDPSMEASLPRMPLKLVFSNIISNAVLHHARPDGNIWIALQDEGPCHHITIRDDGPGIPPEHHTRIFEMFQKLGNHPGAEGHGMGLAFVRRMLEIGGGSVRVESDGQNGSTFHILWPKQPTESLAT